MKFFERKRTQQRTLGQLLRQTEKPPTNDVVLLRLSIRKSICLDIKVVKSMH